MQQISRRCVIRVNSLKYILLLSLFSFTISFTPLNAQTSLSTSGELSVLERHLFTKAFSTDTLEQRLNRLDIFVFGHIRSGSDSKRLNSLMIDVGTVHGDDALEDVEQTASAPESKLVKTADSASIGYPTVSALEKAILGHTENSLPIQQRLANLEIKAFGKESAATGDLATRVDRLKQYEAIQNENNDDYLASPSPITMKTSAPPQSLDISSQLNLLEKDVFAKTYSHDGIISRLDRLEKAVYPAKPIETFSSVPERVGRLMSALGIQNSPSDRPVVAAKPTHAVSIPTPEFSYPLNNGDGIESSSGAERHSSFLHKVGSVLGGIGEAAAMTLGSGMYYPGYGYGGMYGGYPYGRHVRRIWWHLRWLPIRRHVWWLPWNVRLTI